LIRYHQHWKIVIYQSNSAETINLCKIITNWVDIKDDMHVVEDDVLEAIEDLEQE